MHWLKLNCRTVESIIQEQLQEAVHAESSKKKSEK
jgi:hypothetical protein